MPLLTQVKGVCGLKFTDPNLYLMQRLIARLSPDQIVYNGPDEMLALGLQMGAQGGIGTTYNFMPEKFLAIAAHCAAGRFAEAIAVQKQANEVIEALLRYQGLAATKQILHWQGLIASPTCARPAQPDRRATGRPAPPAGTHEHFVDAGAVTPTAADRLPPSH